MIINDPRPILVYDGACEFCTFWVRRWQNITEDSVIYKASQEVASEYPQIPVEKFDSSIYLIYPDGSYFSGAKGVFMALAISTNKLPLWAYEKVPGFAQISELIYRGIAENRQTFNRLTRWIWGNSLGRSIWNRLRALLLIFLVLLSLVCLVTFYFFDNEVRGLIRQEDIILEQISL